MLSLRQDADEIIQASIRAAMPDSAVRRALQNHTFGPGRLVLTAAGKGGWQMAKAAYELLGDRIQDGVVITKYDHAKGPIGNLKIFEAGHRPCDGAGAGGHRSFPPFRGWFRAV